MVIKGASYNELCCLVRDLSPGQLLHFKVYLAPDSAEVLLNLAIEKIRCCNVYLNDWHTQEDVESFVAGVFRRNQKYALAKMQHKGRDRFLCALVGAMIANDFYKNVVMIDFAGALSRKLEMGNSDKALRYLKRGKSKFEREFLL